MKQMTDLQLNVPIHLLIDVCVNAAEVDDTAAVDTILHDLQDSRLYLQMAMHPDGLANCRRERCVCRRTERNVICHCASRKGICFAF